MKDSFVFYRSFKESLSELADNEKLILYEAISDYALDKILPNLSGFPKALFSLIKPQLDANWARFENGKKGGEHGKKGGAPKGNNNANKSKTTPKQPLINPKTTPNDNVNDNDNDNVNKRLKFTPPSLNEISIYISENKLNVDPQIFTDFYNSNGWKIGKNPMKDWRAALNNWSRRNKTESQTYKHPANEVFNDDIQEKIKGF